MICWCNTFCLSLAYISLSLLICARFLCKKGSLDFIFMKVAHSFSEVLGTCSYGSCCYLVTRSCPTLCDPMDSSPLGSSVHGISQTKYWGGLPFPSSGDLPMGLILDKLFFRFGWWIVCILPIKLFVHIWI